MANTRITKDLTRMFSRLYPTTTNPYVQGVATPHNNYQTYQGILTSASAASYQLTAADDGKMYAFKTLSAPNQQSMNILIKELPNTSQFKGSSDLKGGATGVHVTQNGDAAALSAYMSTLKPYDFSWRAALAPYANDPNTGAFVANWVMGSHQVQAYQLGMQNQSMQTGNEAFGVLAWDANQNKYVMLDATNTQATSGSVSGNMPTLGNNQFGFFGMHTHPGNATPSGQDYAMTQQLGLDQMVIGTNGSQAIMTNNPGNQWQGAGFEFEDSYIASRPLQMMPTKYSSYNPPINHGYIVYGANYPGDPKGTVVSFGPSGDGNLVRHGPGTTINSVDRRYWESLKGQTFGPYKLLVDSNGKPISDQSTEDAATGLATYLMYNPTEYSYFGPNSNSGALTVGKDAGAVNYSVPGFSPGQGISITPPQNDTPEPVSDNQGNYGYSNSP